MTKVVLGTCCLCGFHGKLSFEHVPPEAAFNDHRVLRTTFDKVIGSKSLDKLKGQFQQRGAGAYTLCEKCNNDTGSWYGSAYAEWAQQAMRILIGTDGHPTLTYPFNLFPLRVLKQIVCMFFSVTGPNFQKHQPDLVRFVLNREVRVFPRHVRVYAFYTFSDRSRAAGLTGVLSGLGSIKSITRVFSEITFPPFGFVMTVDDSPPPRNDFCDISSFCQFGYQEWRDGISMKLPITPIYTAFPGDYRTREKALADVAASERHEANFRDRP